MKYIKGNVEGIKNEWLLVRVLLKILFEVFSIIDEFYLKLFKIWL